MAELGDVAMAVQKARDILDQCGGIEGYVIIVSYDTAAHTSERYVKTKTGTVARMIRHLIRELHYLASKL